MTIITVYYIVRMNLVVSSGSVPLFSLTLVSWTLSVITDSGRAEQLMLDKLCIVERSKELGTWCCCGMRIDEYDEVKMYS